jgi:hypothetical protein
MLIKFQRQDALVMFYLADDEVTINSIKEEFKFFINEFKEGKLSEDQLLHEIYDLMVDNPQWFAICCAGGLQKFLNRKVQLNETGFLLLKGKEVTKEEDVEKYKQLYRLSMRPNLRREQNGQGGSQPNNREDKESKE